MVQEHPFAPFIRIIGKGPRLSRPLTRDEACDAATMILNGQVDPVQLGAFLCILRVRTEDPNEGAGFVDAVRKAVPLPAQLPAVDLDWPSYAGKARQLPYYLLAALALADSGIKIFMHGSSAHTAGRIYTEQALNTLGIRPASSLQEACATLSKRHFCYLGLEKIHPVLQNIIDLKATLGVRTPVNTFARMTNIFNTPYVLQCITHSAYREIHRDCAALLEQGNMCVFKGEGGEIERRPAKPLNVQFLRDGQRFEEEWPATLPADQATHDDEMNMSRLKEIWQGQDTQPYAIAAITGTMALALRLMKRANSPAEAQEQAEAIWQARKMDQVPYAE